MSVNSVNNSAMSIASMPVEPVINSWSSLAALDRINSLQSAVLRTDPPSSIDSFGTQPRL